jgi:hypothetical protein
MAICDGRFDGRIVDAMAVVAEALIAEKQFVAGRSLLQLMASLEHDHRAANRLMQLNGAMDIPLLLRADAPLEVAPPDAPWRTKFEAAMEPLKKANWLETTTRLTALAAEIPDVPAVWHNLAVIRGWVADNDGARDALLRYAALPVPLESAVEAMATAMLLDPSPLGDDIDIVNWNWTVNDPERFQELLLSDRRVIPVPVDLSAWPVEDSPPPRMVGMLLNRPSLNLGDEVTSQTMPCLLGQMLLFGRQTDRAARVEIMAIPRTAADAAKGILREIGGDSLDAEPKEVIIAKAPASRELITRRWIPPRGASASQVDAVIEEDFRDAVLNRWPDCPLGKLGGRSLRQAAADPAAKVRCLAAILVLEQWVGRTAAAFDFNALRRQLDLPALEPIEPGPGDTELLPLTRLRRVEPGNLPDEELARSMHRAAFYRVWDAAQRFARAVVDRPSLANNPERLAAYRIMAQSATSLEEAVGVVDEARRNALAQGQSCASWDLMDLSFRFAHGDAQGAEEAMRLLQHIETRHMQERGVAQALTQILINAGLLNPDGTPVAMPHGQVPSAAEVAPPEPDPSKLWTPGGETPGAGGGKLWMPGM